jgi:ABC-type molybdate transport system substrate-binding protein
MRRAILTALALLVFTACATKAAPSNELIVFAAASLTETLGEPNMQLPDKSRTENDGRL